MHNLYRVEFRMLDPNKRCSRMVWKWSLRPNAGQMPSSMRRRQQLRCYWLGPKQLWELLDANVNPHRTYFGSWDCYSLWTGSSLSEWVIICSTHYTVCFRVHDYVAPVYLSGVCAIYWTCRHTIAPMCRLTSRRPALWRLARLCTLLGRATVVSAVNQANTLVYHYTRIVCYLNHMVTW